MESDAGVLELLANFLLIKFTSSLLIQKLLMNKMWARIILLLIRNSLQFEYVGKKIACT